MQANDDNVNVDGSSSLEATEQPIFYGPMTEDEYYLTEADRYTKKFKRPIVALAFIGMMFHLLWSAGNALIGYYIIEGHPTGGRVLTIVGALFAVGCVLIYALLAVGALQERAGLLMTWIIITPLLYVGILVIAVVVVIEYPYNTLLNGSFAESEKALLTFLTLVLVVLLLICYVCTCVIVNRFHTLIEKRTTILKGKPIKRRRFRLRIPGLMYDRKGDMTKVKLLGMSYVNRSAH